MRGITKYGALPDFLHISVNLSAALSSISIYISEIRLSLSSLIMISSCSNVLIYADAVISFSFIPEILFRDYS